jgi:hypothetical protein
MNASESPLAVGRKPTRGVDLLACATMYGNSVKSSAVRMPPIAMMCLAVLIPLLAG